jgi:hypothetical protein
MKTIKYFIKWMSTYMYLGLLLMASVRAGYNVTSIEGCLLVIIVIFSAGATFSIVGKLND